MTICERYHRTCLCASCALRGIDCRYCDESDCSKDRNENPQWCTAYDGDEPNNIPPDELWSFYRKPARGMRRKRGGKS